MKLTTINKLIKNEKIVPCHQTWYQIKYGDMIYNWVMYYQQNFDLTEITDRYYRENIRARYRMEYNTPWD